MQSSLLHLSAVKLDLRSQAASTTDMEANGERHQERSRSRQGKKQSQKITGGMIDKVQVYTDIDVSKEWIFMESRGSSYHRIRTKLHEVPTFKLHHDNEWSDVVFGPSDRYSPPNFRIQVSDSQVKFMHSLISWVAENMKETSQRLLGKQHDSTTIMDAYRSPLYENNDKWPSSLRIEVNLLGSVERQTKIINDLQEPLCWETSVKEIQNWRKYQIRAIVYVESVKTFETKCGDKMFAASLKAKELQIRKKQEAGTILAR